MARESIFIDEIRQTERPQFEVVHSTHADVVVDVFVQILRECFATHPLYTYVPREDGGGPDFDLTQIMIVDKYTEEALFLPTITTAFNSANTHWIQFSQTPFQTVLKPQLNADGSIKRDNRGRMVPSHYEYTGAYDCSISFLISANDTIEREELCNLLHVLLAENLRDELHKRGVHVKSVNVGGQSEQAYRNDFIYQVPVTAEIYTEWKRKIPVGDTLKSIGFEMSVLDGSPEDAVILEKGTPIPVYNQENEYYVEDPNSGDNLIADLVLSASDTTPPVTLVFNTLGLNWVVSDFWKEVLDSTIIPYENFALDINKTSQVTEYLNHAGESIIQALKLRALALSQGRKLPDGTAVVSGKFIFEDGRVELKGGVDPRKPLIHSTIVEADDSVVIKLAESNKNQSVLVAKDIILDGYGQVTSGKIYKRTLDNYGSTLDTELTSSDQEFLDGENLNTMTAVDLFMIMQFAQQPHRYSIGQICNQIDKLLEELSDTSVAITFRTQKINSIAAIKRELIERTEQFLLKRPVGL